MLQRADAQAKLSKEALPELVQAALRGRSFNAEDEIRQRTRQCLESSSSLAQSANRAASLEEAEEAVHRARRESLRAPLDREKELLHQHITLLQQRIDAVRQTKRKEYITTHKPPSSFPTVLLDLILSFRGVSQVRSACSAGRAAGERELPASLRRLRRARERTEALDRRLHASLEARQSRVERTRVWLRDVEKEATEWLETSRGTETCDSSLALD